MIGHCACGGVLKCHIQSYDNDRIVKVFCTIKEGNEKCGKRQLRDDMRKLVATELQHQTVFSYRNRCAAKLDDKNGNMLRLHGYDVLRKVKHENKKAQYLHGDPIKALALLKRKTTIGQNVVHKIGYDPFFVQFWSSHQLRTYNANVEEVDASLAIDATGKIAPKITHIDGGKSGHLFLYSATLKCKSGVVPVLRQVTECHDAVSISSWLKDWLRAGAKFPKEVVSRVINIFTTK